MGYYATGTGYIILKNKEDKEKAVERLSWSFYTDTYFSKPKEKEVGIRISCDGNYWEENLYETLNAVKDEVAIKEGFLSFSGDDDCYWQIVYEDGEWIEENGGIVYNGQEAAVLMKDGKPVRVIANPKLIPRAGELAKGYDASVAVCSLIV